MIGSQTSPRSTSSIETIEAKVNSYRFAALLALLIAFSLPHVLVGTQTLIHRDFGMFGYPLAFYHRECFWRGEIPLWNPFNNCGLPFLAQWNTMTLYPPALIYLLLPLPWSLNLFQLLHWLGAGCGMFWLARRWSGSGVAATVAGLAYAFNGLTLHCLMWPNNLAALAWMPWVIGAVEQALGTGRPVAGPKSEAGAPRSFGSVALAGILGALQMLAGAPEISLFTWMLAATVVAGSAYRNPGQVVRILTRAALVAALVLLLSAVQLLPFVDLLRHSHRDTNFATGEWAMPGWGWLNTVVPLFRVKQSASGVCFQAEQHWTSSYYLGAGVMAFALTALLLARNRRVWLAALWALIALILALGQNGGWYDVLRTACPWFNFMRFPIKFVVPAVLAVPLLAAMALGALLQRARSGCETGRWWGGGAVVFIAIAAAMSWAAIAPQDPPDTARTAFSGLTRILFLAGESLCVGWLMLCSRREDPLWHGPPADPRLSRPRPAMLALLMLALLLWLDALTHAPWQNPTASTSVLAPGLFTRERMEPLPQPGTGRALLSLRALHDTRFKTLPDTGANFLMRRAALAHNVNLLDGLSKVDGFFSLYLPAERDVHYRLFKSNDALGDPLADFLGVVQMTAPDHSAQWIVRTNALSMLTIGQKPVFLESSRLLEAVTSEQFDPRREVLLPAQLAGAVPISRHANSRILSQQISAHRILAEVETDAPTLLVIAQADYHCWRGRVDGQPTRVLRANHAFQAVAIPTGRHRVDLTYQDRWFLVGAVLSGAAWLVAVPLVRSRSLGRALRRSGAAP